MQHFRPAIALIMSILLPGCSPLEFSGDAYPQIDIISPKTAPIAFVLGGGGAKGMAHVGVIEELTAAGIHPNLIVGCSAGAIVGGLYAATPDIYTLKNFMMPLRRHHLLTISMHSFPHALSDGEGLQTILQQQFNGKDFKDLPIRFAAVATNLEFGNLTVFTNNDIVPAIMASSAFPGAFSPIKIGRHYYIDGGVVDPVPVDTARKLGGKYIIAIELHTKLPKTSPEHSAGILMRTLEINFNEMSKHVVKNASFHIQVSFDGIAAFDDGLNEEIYEIGRLAARSALPKLCADLQKHFGKPVCYHVSQSNIEPAT